MNAAQKKLVVVMAATGAQGSSIVRYLLQHSNDQFEVRAVTRDPSKPAARALEALGASVVSGDFNDALSIRQAVSGAQMIFHNTDFWGVLSVDKEVAQGLTIAEAAADVKTLEHFVFSGLSDPEKLFNGKYKNNLPYNSKSRIEKGIREKFPGLWSKTTTLYLGLYHSNWLLPVFSPIKVAEDAYELPRPYDSSARIPSVSPTDTGVVVDAILKGGKTYHGKAVAVYSEWISDEEKLQTWAKNFNAKAEFKHVTEENFRQRMEKLGFPQEIAQGAQELVSMLGEGVNYISGNGIIDARTIIDPPYHMKTWAESVRDLNWSSVL